MCKLQKNKAKTKPLFATRLIDLRPTDGARVEVPLSKFSESWGVERRVGRARWEWREQGVDTCEI